jgi:hypothetical protein
MVLQNSQSPPDRHQFHQRGSAITLCIVAGITIYQHSGCLECSWALGSHSPKFGTHVGWSSLTICSSSQTPLNISLPCFLTVAKIVAKGSSKKGGMSFHLAWTRNEGYCAVIGANMFRLKSADRKMKNIGVFLSVLRPA